MFSGGSMRYLKQFLIIITISFIGDLLKNLINLSVPGSIYGMIILFVGLTTKAIKYEDVKDVGKFLVEIMPIMFIPSAVGLVSSWSILKPIIIPVCVITVVTCIAVMFVTGRVSQFIIRKQDKRVKNG